MQPPADPVRITPHQRLEPDRVTDVLALLDAAADADGTMPVSEQVLLHLRHGGDPAGRNLLAEVGPTLVGYAHLDGAEPVAAPMREPAGEPTAELAVHPEHRRHGVGGALVDALEAASPDGRLRLWAHGRHADAAALARSRGYLEERILWQLRRSLLSRLPDAPLPDGVEVRPFLVGVDEQAWLAVNNRAFADHPDQGGWTVADIEVREREPWFDPAGFLLAERPADRTLLGFHWTKVHAEAADAVPIGEVYVLGVDPAAQRLGLGPALTVAGLRYLRHRGLSQVMLYVDESNQPALRLYERLGFTKWDVDVRYQRPGG